ncbi:hypothetical protein [Xenorhabdus sp. SGI246]|uniref:hypothetical protein n=1 Tax=Xenorhabdus sp. SGI246 TaxID=3158263 RepID=UPI00349F6ECD
MEETKTREAMWSTYVTQLNSMLAPGNHMTMLSTPQTKHWIAQLWQKLEYMKKTNFGRINK